MTKQKFGLTVRKEQDFSEWYVQVITKGEMLDYYEIKGCYVMRPTSQFIWKCIQRWFTEKIECLGVQECYFPMLIPKSMLEKEKDHIKNFSPEVAWITKCGDEVLEDPVAIRPTSETIMYPSFSKWIKSHRDLPLKVNQWCSVLRWELHGTLPFIRGKEFLWQEGHTVFLSKEESDEEVGTILDLYSRIYSELLAVPVIKGRKSENEKFGGAAYTTSIEAFIPGSGRGVQAATSHSLGQNFSKMFNIKVDADDGQGDGHVYVYQNSWGITTRSIGISVMIHSDDIGLVLPPRVAMIQVVIVPCGITASTPESDGKMLDEYVEKLHSQLKDAGIRVHVDSRSNITVGFKFNHWEIRGVPLRLEVGPKDMQKNEVCVVRRDTRNKKQVSAHRISEVVADEIEIMHSEMLAKATAERDSRISQVYNFDEFLSALDSKNIVVAPWCCDGDCEMEIKSKSTKVDSNGNVVATGAKTLCIPYEAEACDGMKCVYCNKQAMKRTLFGRSY
ncbi:prolyl-tRNA synthetase [Ordospora colligata]|uniref:Proline--tRNA ligase n=1 Tax=Ordospora colligata OC4 TaxID=1354746 RepID=A0A0B2UM24_9MICR|nr:prolyl-tRNA synthetase [Ordospora colligata OC4]KHN70294.1 prolyl-tRNA synthetase [Ordospora colligata OC4]TBU16838.1 prolyl-tRNA synthetase [Ordospora colligata]TBU16946.1 prolyl-tRNA synthetase [Ordospora colligata]TBU19387.1 prolyl-tRNA synthetase [Ordospora colligata]